MFVIKTCKQSTILITRYVSVDEKHFQKKISTQIGHPNTKPSSSLGYRWYRLKFSHKKNPPDPGGIKALIQAPSCFPLPANYSSICSKVSLIKIN